jgi:hypothetical protein
LPTQTKHPALAHIERNGPLLDDVPVYLGYKEVAARWGCGASAIRGYWQDDIARGESRYLPAPDAMLLRDETLALPGWLESTIDTFERISELVGPGNHTRGEHRRGNTNGRKWSQGYQELGRENAEFVLNAADSTEFTVEWLCNRFGLTPSEVQRIQAGRSEWTRKERERPTPMSPAYKSLGVRRADEIRAKVEASDDPMVRALLAEAYGITEAEVQSVLDNERWVSARQKASA